MDWKNLRDTLPQNEQTVLICIDGIYRVATYNHLQGYFQEMGTNHRFLIRKRQKPIYWSEVETAQIESRQAS